jgi:hypothetical protein
MLTVAKPNSESPVRAGRGEYKDVRRGRAKERALGKRGYMRTHKFQRQ